MPIRAFVEEVMSENRKIKKSIKSFIKIKEGCQSIIKSRDTDPMPFLYGVLISLALLNLYLFGSVGVLEIIFYFELENSSIATMMALSFFYLAAADLFVFLITSACTIISFLSLVFNVSLKLKNINEIKRLNEKISYSVGCLK